MTNANWGLLDPNAFGRGMQQGSQAVGGVFQAFEQGRQRRKEQDTENALAQYATASMGNGIVAGDQQTAQANELLKNVIKANPRLGLQLAQQRQQQQSAGLERHRESIITGAKIFRQLGVKDEATYQQARGIAQQMGIDLADVPPQYDPQYVQGVVAIADTFAPPKQDSQPASVEEYQFARGQGFQGGYMDFIETKRGPMPVQGFDDQGNPTITFVPRGMAQGGQPQGQLPPPPPGFVIDEGGPTSQASGGFPR